jgi:3-oxoacyl-[acyl-carrier-protein] synthase III
MALTKSHGIEIVGIETIIPHTIEDNLNLQLIAKEESESIVEHTGIRYRRVLKNKEIGIKTLFEKGITSLLTQLDWEKESIDVLICVTQTPQTAIPSVACQLHGDLKLGVDTLCYDINSGCSGFVYGLHTLSAILATFDKENVRALLCCGDISSQITDSSDRSVRPIFSDAASVVAVEKTKDTTVSGFYNLQTDGSGQKAIYTEQKGSDVYMKLNGIDVFTYSMKWVPKNISGLLAFAKKDIDYPDLFVFHQANKLINTAIAHKIKVPEEKTPSSLYEYGNTASASIPLTIGTTWSPSKMKSGWIVLVGFGVGFSIASALIKFNPKYYNVPQELNFE